MKIKVHVWGKKVISYFGEIVSHPSIDFSAKGLVGSMFCIKIVVVSVHILKYLE